MVGEWMGWALAFAAVVAGWLTWGWRGVALAVSAIIFKLLSNFSQALKLMRAAAGRPLGLVPSAVMLHARLAPGMRLLAVIKLAGSLGQEVTADVETYAWHDESGARVVIAFVKGRITHWTLERPDEGVADAGAAGAGSPAPLPPPADGAAVAPSPAP